MSWRTVIISRRSKLDYRMGYLVVRTDEVKRIFLEEIAILVIEDPSVSFTGCLMEALLSQKVRVIFCDSRHLPLAEVEPYHGSHDSALKIRQQTRWSDAVKALVWQSIIREKIGKQAEHLAELGRAREAELLRTYLQQVEPGDATNREGHAAKVYFNALFGMDFTRGAECPVNAALNYGYAILLAAVNREIAAAGYLTQLGVFHQNRFNHFNLGSDLIEPFRVLVDRVLIIDPPGDFTNNEKHALWDILNDTVYMDGSKQTVMNAMHLYVHSVLNALNEEQPERIRYYQLK